MFSVLMSVYKNDDPSHFYDALDSIAVQTLAPSQVVLVVDGPISDLLDSVIEQFEVKLGKRGVSFRVERLKQNVGLGRALSSGVDFCTESYIVRMDSDDISAKNRLESLKRELAAFEYPDVLGSYIEEFKDVVGDLKKLRKVPLEGDKILEFSKIRNPMNHVTVCIKKDSLMLVGGYESVIYHEDYYLWLKFLSSGMRLVNSPEVSVYVRVGNDMAGRRRGFSYLKYELRFLRKAIKMGCFSPIDAARYLAPRVLVRMLPGKAVSIVYGFLRS